MDNNHNLVLLASIVIDERFQTRVAMDQGAIEDYVDAISKEGRWPFPPLKIVSQFLVDGFHRIEAAKRVISDPETSAELRKSLRSIPCERVTVDSRSDNVPDLALQHALEANRTHGLRRTNADKRRSVELAIDKWPSKSDREIAKLTGTSHTFASRVRGELRVATLPLESEQQSQADSPREVVTPPRESEEVFASDGPKKVETLPLAKQRTPNDSEAQRPNPKEAARMAKNLAHQYRDRLARAICDYHQHNPDVNERDRLVKLVQGVRLW